MLNFKRIVIHTGIKNKPDEVQIYVYLHFQCAKCHAALSA